MLTIADVSKSYGTRELFEEVSLFVSRTDRYGLVGPNGAGKTTLFNLILGEEMPDEGTITWERGADFGYLPQETDIRKDNLDATILDLATAITPEFAALRDKVRVIEAGGHVAQTDEEIDAHERFDH